MATQAQVMSFPHLSAQMNVPGAQALQPQPQQLAPQPQVPQTGLIGSENALQGGLQGSIQALLQGATQGRQDINTGLQQSQASIGQGVGALDPFAKTGMDAQQLQAALSGVLGQDAFNEALINSPATQFLSEQGNRATLANASAAGNVQGGNVLKELSRFNQGLASTDLQNQIANANLLSNQGLTAAGGQANLFGQQGAFQNQAANALSNIAVGTGQNVGQAAFDTGQLLSSGRTRAGEQIAGELSGTSSALSNLINEQGAGISDITSQSAANIVNLLTQSGALEGASQEQLAALLANISIGEGTASTSLPSIAGNIESGGILQGLGSAASGVGGLLTGLNT